MMLVGIRRSFNKALKIFLARLFRSPSTVRPSLSAIPSGSLTASRLSANFQIAIGAVIHGTECQKSVLAAGPTPQFVTAAGSICMGMSSCIGHIAAPLPSNTPVWRVQSLGHSGRGCRLCPIATVGTPQSVNGKRSISITRPQRVMTTSSSRTGKSSRERGLAPQSSQVCGALPRSSAR